MQSPLRLGVVGVGHLGRHHARILAGLDGVRLVGVVDARAEQARAIAEPLGAEAFDDPRELLDRVDAVSIAVPTVRHHAVASLFLDRGIPALVEKPIASTAAEAADLVRRAEAAGVALAVGHIERFNPAFEALAQAGWSPRFLNAERLGIYTFRSTDIGVVHDLMIHDIDLVLSLIPSPIVAVEAVGVPVFGATEDVAEARLVFESGTVATLRASRASDQAVRKLDLWAREGYAYLDFATRSATLTRPSEALQAGNLGLTGLDLTRADVVKAHVFGELLRPDSVPAPQGGPDQLTRELADFVQAVRTGGSPRVTGAAGLEALRVADRVVASLQAHRWDRPAAGSAIPVPKLRARMSARAARLADETAPGR
jgi:predicted dehydrogenase